MQKEWNATFSCSFKYLNTVILTLLIDDADLLETNTFAFKILDDSLLATQFAVRTNADGSGSLIALRSLNLTALREHENGINLTVYVSDNGIFTERDHIDSARVFIKCDDYHLTQPKEWHNGTLASDIRGESHVDSEPRRVDYEFEQQLTSTEFIEPMDVIIPNKCDSLPCRNGATCINFANDNFLCVCAAGYSGALCDLKSDSSTIGFNPLSMIPLIYYLIGIAIPIVLLLPIIYCVLFCKPNTATTTTTNSEQSVATVNDQLSGRTLHFSSYPEEENYPADIYIFPEIKLTRV